MIGLGVSISASEPIRGRVGAGLGRMRMSKNNPDRTVKNDRTFQHVGDSETVKASAYGTCFDFI